MRIIIPKLISFKYMNSRCLVQFVFYKLLIQAAVKAKKMGQQIPSDPMAKRKMKIKKTKTLAKK